jgi:endonuclease-3 related protein
MIKIRSSSLKSIYNHLYREYGPQYWWPGDTPFEVMVGAILTQNTAWANVEKAIANLTSKDKLGPEAIAQLPHHILADLLKPSGYFNIKANRLRNFCMFYLEQGKFEMLKQLDTGVLRQKLLSVNGVGHETADDMLLYAFGRPVFVIDAYTRRIFSRYGLIDGDESYDLLRHSIENSLEKDVVLYNEYHALIVQHGKDICKVKPRCSECCLKKRCATKQ